MTNATTSLSVMSATDSIDSVATGRSLELGHVLTAKEEEDGHVDLVFLAGLRNRVSPKQDPMPLPDWVHDKEGFRSWMVVELNTCSS